MKKVSVIVPVYNTEEYLNKCLDSLVNQTLDDIEIVVINDGSTDGSQEIIDTYKAKYPEKIVAFYQQNSGQAVARNRAIEKCTGEYVGFLDSDDYAKYDLFEKMYDAAKEIDADYAVCNHYYVTQKKSSMVTTKCYSSVNEMFIDVLVSPWNKIYKREILLKSNSYFPEGVVYEDTSFYVKQIPYIKKFVNVDEPLLYHLERGGSTMNAKQNKRVTNIFPVLNDALGFYKEKGFLNDYKAEFEYFYVKILLFSSVRRICCIRDAKLRKEWLLQTMSMIKTNFPNYKKNKYFKLGKMGTIVRFIDSWNICLYADLIYISDKIKKRWVG